ncbi:hypothetical protein D9M68_832910 [compost metagenome]
MKPISSPGSINCRKSATSDTQIDPDIRNKNNPVTETGEIRLPLPILTNHQIANARKHSQAVRD